MFIKTIFFIIFLNPIMINAETLESVKDISFEGLFKELTKRISELDIKQPNYITENSELMKDPRYYVKVYAKDKYERTKLLEAGVDIFSINDSYIEGFIHKDFLNILSEKEFKIIDKKTLSEWVALNKDFPSQDSAYHNYNETYEVFKTLSDKYKTIASLFSIGKSYEGRDIWALRINTSQKYKEKSTKPGILFVGNHHAREHLSNEMVLLLAAYILDNYQNTDIKKYIQNLDIYFIPMINPDGVEYDIVTGSYKWWRKNTNKLGTNSVVGVDLNRNYDFEWCKAGASTYQNSDTYCGKSAFSEPETKALKVFLLERTNIKMLLSYHSYSSLVLYPWGGKDEPVSDEKDRNAFIKHANQMAKLLNYKAQQSSDLYIASGDMADWAYDKFKILAFTIELEGNSFYPGSNIIKTAFDKNKNAALYLMSVTENPYQ
ncbi:MAG: M14 family metallopeptidase [Elusimicrobiales bacterium]|nr:M14 family metallopeptidase [Elusimicrobiales bacterium]